MNNQQFIKFFSKEYNPKVLSASVLRDGPDNTVWLIIADNSQKYVARVSKRKMKNEIAFEAEWLRFLHISGIPVAPILETRKRKTYAVLSSGEAVTVFNFISGKHLSVDINTPPPKKAVISAAQALAKIHNASRGHIISLPRRRTVFSELERVSGHMLEIKQKVAGGKEFLQEVKESLAWGKAYQFNSTLIHNDYRIGNIIFSRHNNIAAIIDFDWCCLGPAIKDVAHSLAEWSFIDGAKNHCEEVFNAFLDGYNQIAIDPVLLNNNLYRWIALSCLSDVSTYLIDRLEQGEIKPISKSFMYQKFKYFNKMTQSF